MNSLDRPNSAARLLEAADKADGSATESVRQTRVRGSASSRPTKQIRQRRTLVLVAMWLLIGLIALGMTYAHASLTDEKIPFIAAVGTAFPAYVLWALFTPVVFYVGRRFSPTRPFRTWRTIALVVSLVVLSVVHPAILAAYQRWLNIALGYDVPGYASVFESIFLQRFHLNILIVGAIIGVDYAFRNYARFLDRDVEASRLQAREAELQAQLTRARLDALTRQLQPHFLFNTLNSISALMSRDASAAREMIANLSELLRITLETSDEQEVPLRVELQILERYLAIQQIRFQETLRVRFETGVDANDAMVPLFLLQPLVENALKHASAPDTAVAEIVVSADRDDDVLLLEVRDNGRGLNGVTFKKGIGLTNTELRLGQLYGEEAHLELLHAREGGLNARVRLPYYTTRDTFVVEAHE